MKRATFLLLILISFAFLRVSSQNAPISTAGVIETTGTSAIVPITADNFNNVASCNLRLYYDPAIATAINVTKGALLPGNLNVNVVTPGIVALGWYHSANVTLPSNSVIFNISFTKVTSGTTAITWFDNGNSCKYSDLNSVVLTDVPTASFYLNGSLTFQDFAPTTYIPATTACPGSQVCIPVKVDNFNTIGAVSLTINYNTSSLTYVAPATPNPAWPDLEVDYSIPGTLVIGGLQTGPGVTLPDNSTLVTLCFDYLGGTGTLNFIDNGTSCEYAGPNGTPVLLDSPQSSFYLDGTISLASPVWTGAVSTAWETPGNWNCNIVPTSSSNVTINNSVPNYPAISSAVIVNDLTINSGASLTINPLGSLTVTTDLINNAGTANLLVKSDATGTGSLITNDPVNATVQRYINSPWTDCCHGWHFLSSPVSAQAIQPEFVSNTIPDAGVDFYSWGEAGNTWINAQTTSGWNPAFGSNFVVGKGYVVAYQSLVTKNFSGILNVSDVSVTTLTNNTSTANHGWNLLGNPFSSALKWNDGNWALSSGMASTAKIWDEVSAAYVDIAANDIIPSMNGFMVQVVNPATTGSLTIPAASRVHSATPWYKSNEGKLLLVARDEENNTAQQCVIKMNSEATEGFDKGFDSHYLAGYAPMFYSIQGDEILSTNTLPDLGDTRKVELGFIKNSAAQFTIQLDQQNLIPDLKVFLTDKKLNKEIDLLTQPLYSFTSEATDAADRFRLSFKRVTSIVEPVKAEILRMVVSDGILNIISLSKERISLQIIDMSGRVIRNSAVNPGNTEMINLTGLPGVYVVKAVSNEAGFSGKVVVK